MTNEMQNFFITLILFFSSFLFSNSKPVAIVVHGGAGWFENMPEGQVEGIMKGLEDSMNIGYDILNNGGSTLMQARGQFIHLNLDKNLMLLLCMDLIMMPEL